MFTGMFFYIWAIAIRGYVHSHLWLDRVVTRGYVHSHPWLDRLIADLGRREPHDFAAALALSHLSDGPALDPEHPVDERLRRPYRFSDLNCREVASSGALVCGIAADVE